MEKLSTRKLGFLMLLVTLMIYEPTVSQTETPSLARPNCQDHCGNISIPYPFGIGKGCYKNEWYIILCNRTRAFLQSIQREVTTDITVGDNGHRGKIHITGSVISSGCSSLRSEMSSPLNLTGSPFFLSEQNKLTVVGCNATALMTSTEPGIVECETTCDPTGAKNIVEEAKCSGYKCCQTRIPVNLQVNEKLSIASFLEVKQGVSNTSSKIFSIHLNSQHCRVQLLHSVAGAGLTLSNLQAFGVRIEGDTGESCKVAFLSEKTFSPLNSSNLELLVSEEPIPVVLDWYFDETINADGDSFCTSSEYDVPNKNISRCWCRTFYGGNPYLPGGCSGIVRYYVSSATIIGGLFLGFGLLFLVVGIWLCCRCAKQRKKKKTKRKLFKRNGGLLLQQQLSSTEGNVEKTRIFNSKELAKATDKFSENRILGQGGQGTVYKGMLVDGRIVAVKKSKVDQENLKDFVNEVVILSQINHRNVVKLLGCCLETEVPMLVYEFIPNGNLYDHLHDQSDEFPLTWEVRLRIATEIAGALSYLHSAASIPIYHRDIKTTNILLDEKYRAKISDFGTSRSISIDQTHLTTLVQGTIGYVDPEYFQTSQFTEKSDVYSFGVVLVELLTGEKPISVFRPQEVRVLATYFVLSMRENKLFDILDARISEQCRPEEVRAVGDLARRCLSSNRKDRPNMREVSTELERILPQNQDSKFKIWNNKGIEEVKLNIPDSCNSAFTAPASQCAAASSSSDVEPLVPQQTR